MNRIKNAGKNMSIMLTGVAIGAVQGLVRAILDLKEAVNNEA